MASELALIIGAIGGGILSPILNFFLSRLKARSEAKKIVAEAQLQDATADRLEVKAALDYVSVQEAQLTRYNDLFNEVVKRDQTVLELNRLVTGLQADLHRVETQHSSELAILREELDCRDQTIAERDRTIEELRVELTAERQLRKTVERRLAEIDPTFQIAKETQAT